MARGQGRSHSRKSSASQPQAPKMEKCISAPAAPAPTSQEPVKLEKCISAPAAPVTSLHWPGAGVKVRNTFVHVEMEDGSDEEMVFLQSCRRRTTFSCPFFSTSPEPDQEKEPEHFEAEPAREPSPEQSGATIVQGAYDDTSSADGGVEEQEPFHEIMARAIAKHHECNQRSGTTHAKTPKQHVARTRRSKQNRTGGDGRDGSRLWCHVFIDPCMLEPGFDLVKKIIGRSGCNTRAIFESTGTKIRVRGMGSGHVEHRLGREAPVPLMIALAAESACEESFRQAFSQTKELLKNVADRFNTFCGRQGLPAANKELFSIGDTSKRSLSCLSPADLDGMRLSLSGQLQDYAKALSRGALRS